MKNLLKPNGKIIVNTKLKINNEVYSFDGNSISDSLKLPVVNTVMLGTISALSEIVESDDIYKAIELYMPNQIQDRNKKAVFYAIKEVSE